MTCECSAMIFPLILFNLFSPKTNFPTITAGENSPNFACFPLLTFFFGAAGGASVAVSSASSNDRTGEGESPSKKLALPVGESERRLSKLGDDDHEFG